MMNILNGGAHADNNVDFQEFMVMPVGAERFSDALRWGVEVFHTLKGVLKKKGYNTAVGDEGGFAPSLKSNVEAIEVILEAIQLAGYKAGEEIAIALDPASSEFYDAETGKYVFKKSDKSERTSEEMVHFWAGLGAAVSHRFASRTGWPKTTGRAGSMLTEKLGEQVQLVGDDLFVTNTKRLQRGIEEGVANSILIKVNQIGTVSETLEAIELGGAMDTRRSFRTAAARRKTRLLPTLRWRRVPARSRPDRPRARTASPSTTSCCALKRNWDRRRSSSAWSR